MIFFKDKIQYLGHVVTKEGISVGPEKIRAIEDWPIPKDVTDVRSFIGITGYYRRSIEGFSRITNPITSLQKKGKKFDWNQKCEESFRKLNFLLRMYVKDQPGKWEDYLHLVEFAYNNNYQTSAKFSPFEILYGWKCNNPISWSNPVDRLVLGPDC